MINFSNYIKCQNEKDVLREKYLNEDIFVVGTKIIHGDKVGEIIRRGPNYVISLDENQNVFRSWITDIKEYHEEIPKKINKYRNYNNSRDNMDSVQSAVIFLGMLPEHSYKIRRAVERTILERMDYDTAIETISEDLKSEFLFAKAIEYYDAVIAEADQQMIAAKKQMQQQQDQMKKQAMQQKVQMQKQEMQKQMQKQAQKSASMKEEEEIDEAGVFLRRGKRQKLNPNELRVQAQKGSRLAKQLRAERGLGEEHIQEEDPCWKGYTQVGMKKRSGKEVPNCVPSKGVPKAKGYKTEELKGGQNKIDVAPPYGKLTADDFKKLRAKKKMEEQEGHGGVAQGFGFQGILGSSGKNGKYRKEDFSDWRSEISLSDNLVEKVVKGNVTINPSTNDCPNCGDKMERNACPNCDTGVLRTKYREESYEIIEKHLSAAEAKKKEEIVKSMKKGLSGFEKRYGSRAKEVMYATATKQAKKVAEDIDMLDEAQDRYGVYDRSKGSFVQTGISQQSAKALYQRLVKGGGRSSKEITIRKVKY